MDETRDVFDVVVNLEGQYSIWLAGRPIPEGWSAVGFSGAKADCLSRIEELWTDMRPRSLR
ncbi:MULTISPECIES: MbtH family protein [Streptomyces]|uniref:MbtH family protein n=1 Tax=Streptomyces TaxID=1883 RepID=UPI0013BD8902|nr:MbtH family NRPS accessory protein [Streptomyces sp. SID8014]NEC13782.1 MbtH family NRPS accessory protein [Streptomyces sp. SID8014]